MANDTQFAPSPQEKIIGIKHVVYEYANLLSAAHHSLRGNAPWRTHCDDAFLLGCRKIGDFLMEDKRSRKGTVELDDVLALDYLPRPPNPGDPIRKWALPIWIGEWREAMNKQLAHIAYKRDKEWDHRKWVPRIEDEFRKAWWGFIDSITHDGFRREFEKQLSACQSKPGFGAIDLRRR